MNISQQFAPPFKLIAPFFIIGLVGLLTSCLMLFAIDISQLHYQDAYILSVVHTFFLTFVMMIIFGAMAQLIPVVLEVEHFAVELYYAIYPLLFIGSVLMIAGFLYIPTILPFGGLIVCVGFLIFFGETTLTILKVTKLNFAIVSVIIANIFLIIGLTYGIIMAIGYAGILNIEILKLLSSHIFSLVFGYVFITIIGLSMTLLPMFWLSHSFSWRSVKIALGLLSLAIVFILFDTSLLTDIAYVLLFLGFGFYIYEIYIIYHTRVRLEKDIYYLSMVFSFVSFVTTVGLFIWYMISQNEQMLYGAFWFGSFGFVAFIISGHLYKIVPFLIWYERFAPLVGKQKVPMLHDMIDDRSANIGFVFNSLGVVVSGVSIILKLDTVFTIGVLLLSIGSVILIKDIIYIIKFKENKI